MKSFTFELKTKAIFGAGEFKNLDKYLKEFNFRDISIIIDKNVYNSPYVNEYIESISYFDKKLLEYDFGEPTYQLLQQYRSYFDREDCIIAIGGGSVLDFAKGLSFLATNKKPAIEYRGFPRNCNKPIPVIAIPTTAGTGSEVTYNAVFIDENKKKLGINTTLNYPTLAILDPKLIQSCPKSVMVSSGMDALVHAVESFGVKQSNDLTHTFSEKAINLLTYNLQHLKDKKLSIETISNLQLGAYIAGIALMNSGSGPAGALSYILGPQFNIPHGLAGAIFLPHIVKFNEENGFEYTEHTETFWHYKLSDVVTSLCRFLDVDYQNIRKYNVTKASDLRILAKGIETLQPAFDQNPVPFTVEDAKNIIRSMV